MSPPLDLYLAMVSGIIFGTCFWASGKVSGNWDLNMCSNWYLVFGIVFGVRYT